MAEGGLDVGRVFARLGASFSQSDQHAFADFDREVTKARAVTARPITAELKADVDRRSFDQGRREFDSLGHSVAGFNRGMTAARNSIQLMKWPALITGAGLAAQAVSALAGGVGALTAGLAPASGALAAFPALGSAAAQGMGTFKLATTGVTDALGGLNDEIDKDKLKKLTGPAQAFVRTLDALKPRIRDLQRDTQRGLFPGLEDGLERAARNFGVIERAVPRTARVIGDLARQAGELVGSRGFGRDLETQMRRNDTSIRRLGEGGLNLANALRHVTIEAGPLVGWLTRMGVRFTELIEHQTRAAREAGTLAGFFEQTRVQMDRLFRIAGDVGTALFNIGKAAYPLGNDLLRAITRNAEAFKDWTESARGQNALRDYFDRVRPAVFEVGRLMRDITQAFFRLGSGDQVAPLLRTIRTRLLPAIEDLIDSTTRSFGPALLDVAEQAILLFTKLAGDSGPLHAFMVTLGTALEFLNKLIDTFPILGKAIVTISAIGGISKALGLVSAISGVKTLNGLLRGTRNVAAGAAAAEGAAGAAGGGGLLGGLGNLIRRFPRAAGVTGIAAALATLQGTLQKLRENKATEGLAKQLELLVKDRNLQGLERLNDHIREYESFPGGIDKATDAVDRAREAIEATGRRGPPDLKKVQDAAKETTRQFRLMRRNTEGELGDLQDVVRRNMLRIKDHLGAKSREGKEALADNFRQAQHAIRVQMRRGEISTRDGMRAIRGYLQDELQVYGLSLRQARNISRGGGDGRQFGDPDANRGREGGAFRQQGGWLVARGMVGSDTIEVAPGNYAAAGEYYAKGPGAAGAVINRHQAPVVELALMRGGHTLDTLPRDHRALPMIEAALADWGGLNAVFGSITRPHAFQRGGYPGVTGDTDFLPQLGRALSAMARATHTPIFVQSGRRTIGEQAALYAKYGPGRAAAPSANAPHVRGVAGDITPGQSVFGGVAGRFGLGFTVPGEPWHIQLLNAAAAGAMGPAAARIARVIIQGGGAVGRVAQGALDLGRSGAQRLLDRASFFPGAAGGETAVGSAAGANPAVIAAFRRAISATGANRTARLALWEAGIVESGLRNLNYGDADSLGALQERTSIYGRTHALNPYLSALRFLGQARAHMPWRGTAGALAQAVQRSAFPGRYDAVAGQAARFLRGGGRIARFLQGGGRTLPPNVNVASGNANTGGGGGGHAGISLRALRRRGRIRIGNFEDIVGELEDLQRSYGQVERRYDQSDEQLINEDTGEIDKAALAKRLGELDALITIRQRIRNFVRNAGRMARRILANYQTIARRLSRSLQHAKGKDRRGIREQLRSARGQVREWGETAKDLGFDLEDARLDIGDLKGERAEVAGTRVESSDGAGGGDGGGGGATPDELAVAEQIRTANERLEADNRVLRAAIGVFRGPADIGVYAPGTAGNAFAAAAGYYPVGAGPRSPGYAGDPGPLGAGAQVIVNYSSLKATGAQLQEIGGVIVSALGAQPTRVVPRERVGG